MKIKQCHIFYLYNKRFLALFLFFFIFATIVLLTAFLSTKSDNSVTTLECILFFIVFCISFWGYTPRKLRIEGGELSFKMIARRKRRHLVSLFVGRAPNIAKYFKVRKITKIEYGQKRTEKLFKLGHATVYGEFLTFNWFGEPVELSRQPTFMTFYGMVKILFLF